MSFNVFFRVAAVSIIFLVCVDLLWQIQWSYCIHTVRMRNCIRKDKHAGEPTSYSRK